MFSCVQDVKDVADSLFKIGHILRSGELTGLHQQKVAQFGFEIAQDLAIHAELLKALLAIPGYDESPDKKAEIVTFWISCVKKLVAEDNLKRGKLLELVCNQLVGQSYKATKAQLLDIPMDFYDLWTDAVIAPPALERGITYVEHIFPPELLAVNAFAPWQKLWRDAFSESSRAFFPPMVPLECMSIQGPVKVELFADFRRKQTILESSIYAEEDWSEEDEPYIHQGNCLALISANKNDLAIVKWHWWSGVGTLSGSDFMCIAPFDGKLHMLSFDLRPSKTLPVGVLFEEERFPDLPLRSYADKMEPVKIKRKRGAK